MKARSGLVALLTLAAAVAGCASGGATSGPVIGPDGEPVQVAARPSDDNFTTSAQLYLTQAQAAGDETEAAERSSLAAEAALNAINANPQNPLAYLLVGQAYLGMDDMVAADSMLQKATDIYPPYAAEGEAYRENSWVDYYNGALGQLNSGDLDGAIESFENAHTIFKGRPEAMLQLGAAYSQKGDFETSAAYFQQVLDLVEGTDYALADSMRVAGWDEYEIQAARFLGQVLTQAENYDEAAAAYTSFLETHPGDVTIMAQLAMVTMAAGDTASAERMYNDLLNMPNITARELYDVGVGLFQSEAYLASAQAFEKVIAVAPNHRDALFNLVTALYQAEQWDRVIELGESLRELDPHNPLAFQYSAFAYAQSGDSDTGVALQETGQNLPFTIDNTRLQPFSSGGASLSGQVTNNTLAEGTPVSLRINFIGLQGGTVGSVEVTVVAGAAGMAEVFQAELDSETEVIGFFYEVL